jgi:TolB-like protein/lipoprotein NlpI
MVSGRRAFARPSVAETFAAVLKDEPADLESLVPTELRRVINHCLEKSLLNRFQSARDLAFNLRTIGSDTATAAPPESTSGIDSLAVLPFTNASGDPDIEYLSDGITESLINRLSQIPKLRVVPRSSVFRYKGRHIDPNKAGRQLKARALLTGKVLQRGDTLTVQAELVDVKQEAQLWGDRFVRRVSDILAVEDEIARQITEKLRLKLTGEERERLARRYTEDTEAYHLYLKGRYYWSKRTGPNLKKSVGYFEQAIAKDAGYALPYAGLADAYVVMSAFDAGVPTDLLSKGKAAARRALEIDPDLPEAQAELCLIWPCLDRDWGAADDAFRSAMGRKPDYWLAHDHYALVLAAQGRFEEALAEVQRGKELEPLSLVVHHHVAWVSLLARRYDDAIAECRSALEMDPAFGMAYRWMGIGLEQKGLYDEAIASLDQAVKFDGGTSMSVAAAAHAYAMSGRIEEARRRLAELQQAAAERYVEPYAIALIFAALGDPEQALQWLEQAYRDHSFWFAISAKVDPRMDVLRRDARFQDLLRRLGLGSN